MDDIKRVMKITPVEWFPPVFHWAQAAHALYRDRWYNYGIYDVLQVVNVLYLWLWSWRCNLTTYFPSAVSRASSTQSSVTRPVSCDDVWWRKNETTTRPLWRSKTCSIPSTASLPSLDTSSRPLPAVWNDFTVHLVMTRKVTRLQASTPAIVLLT